MMKHAKPRVGDETDNSVTLVPAQPVRRRSGSHRTVVGVLLVAAAGFAIAHFLSPHADLRVTTGAPGSTAQRFVSAFVALSEAPHPRIRLTAVEEDDLSASGKALEKGL